ncbi:nuclear transport factor 2 family protein [Rhodohalobacter sulfatireducens]|uniref:Nuclear transport factor 2 family protein n=1 Tax=Rhodohalobacter sulfatireducens TaxID=2911366 RepID=A0ABS9K9S5_9BACT|nr:hypothetical protein [Rhodohalobacter sulfatireducens]MCG2587609.1 hypothetical protein [Rhodohalobacter sulfatireducens]
MKNNLIPILSIACILTVLGCEGETMEPSSSAENSRYEIASEEYVDLSLEALNHLSDFDIDAWGTLLADDVEYYFPDGDSGTRTVLNGKTEVVNWWKNWVASSGIESMTITQPDLMPIRVNSEALNYSALTGVFVISYFSNELAFDNGNTVNLRMNFALHFNEDSLIDRYYTYYDRALIIEAMNVDILNPETD